MQSFKITLIFVIIGGSLLLACNNNDKPVKERTLQTRDSLSEAKIDSAYKVITDQCDTLMVKLVPVMVDSLLKNDSFKLNKFFDTQTVYTGDEKAEKIIRQLRADCDSNLLKETYKRRRLLPISKPKRFAKAKN